MQIKTNKTICINTTNFSKYWYFRFKFRVFTKFNEKHTWSCLLKIRKAIFINRRHKFLILSCGKIGLIFLLIVYSWQTTICFVLLIPQPQCKGRKLYSSVGLIKPLGCTENTRCKGSILVRCVMCVHRSYFQVNLFVLWWWLARVEKLIVELQKLYFKVRETPLCVTWYSWFLLMSSLSV